MEFGRMGGLDFLIVKKFLIIAESHLSFETYIIKLTKTIVKLILQIKITHKLTLLRFICEVRKDPLL